MNNPTKITSAFRLAAMMVLALASTAVAIDLSKLPPASTQAGVTFNKDIKLLIEASCARCHGAERPKGGLQVTTLAGVLKGTKGGKVVEPGNSAASDLVIAVSQLDPEIAMPPKPRAGKWGGPGGNRGTNTPTGADQGKPTAPPRPLTPEQVGLVRAWIDQGAK